ncbi:hypothetical protein HanPSC8_Chr14g0638951 [Helianthus annuus]|nr:hypothetical protein HanPSC8_Chr14g0638951 [Helianthus annuus]
MIMHMVVVTLALRVFKKNDFLTFHSNVFHMVIHMIVVTLALRVFLTKGFLTFHSNVFHKLPLTQNYLFFTFNIKLFIFCNLSSQLFYFQLWSFIIFIFRKFFRFMLRSKIL